MENKRVLKIVTVSALMFGALVAIIEYFLFGQHDLASDIILYTIVLAPVTPLAGLMGYQGQHFEAHLIDFLALNVVLCSDSICDCGLLIIIVIAEWRDFGKNQMTLSGFIVFGLAKVRQFYTKWPQAVSDWWKHEYKHINNEF